jgi:hypothetical protein
MKELFANHIHEDSIKIAVHIVAHETQGYTWIEVDN